MVVDGWVRYKGRKGEGGGGGDEKNFWWKKEGCGG